MFRFKVFSALFFFLLSLVACSTPSQTPTPVPFSTPSVTLGPEEVRPALVTAVSPTSPTVASNPCQPPSIDFFSGQAINQWRKWEGNRVSYPADRSIYSFYIENNQLVVELDPADESLPIRIMDKLSLTGFLPVPFGSDLGESGGAELILGPLFFYSCEEGFYISDELAQNSTRSDACPFWDGVIVWNEFPAEGLIFDTSEGKVIIKAIPYNGERFLEFDYPGKPVQIFPIISSIEEAILISPDLPGLMFWLCADDVFYKEDQR